MEESISVRIGKEELKEINKISEYKKTNKSFVLREILKIGIKQKILEIALEKFQKNEITAAKAAKIAELSLTEFLDVIHERGINFHYGVEELREDFERLIDNDK